MDGRAGGCPDGGEGAHGLLHGQRAGHAPAAVVALQPAGDRVAGEAHNAAAVAVQLGDDRLVNGVDLVKDFFGPALDAQLLGQRRCQRGKAGDIGKENAALGAVGQLSTAGQGQPSILGNECQERFHSALITKRKAADRFTAAPVWLV